MRGTILVAITAFVFAIVVAAIWIVYVLSRMDEIDGYSKENFFFRNSKKKGKFKQDFGGDCLGGAANYSEEKIGIPDIGFARGMRQILDQEKPKRVITDHDLALANETMLQMGRNEF